jgi:cytochrome c oxidase subunit 2
LHTTPLLWGTIVVSLGVVAFVSIALLGGIFRRREPFNPSVVNRPAGGLRWIYIGVGVSSVFLLATTVWTVVTLGAVSGPSKNPALRLEVIGHQWWWEIRYLNDDVSRIFTTANEIHIPLGETVQIDLRAADVIHSFWVPKLAGKTDLIPGQRNRTWIEARKTGVYRGQCGEYCGLQHAHMALSVIADTPADFKAWWDRQLAAPAPALTENALASETAFFAKCGVCHAVRGTRAGGILGPDLSHLMTRGSIAAGALPNDMGHLSGWIADPQSVKPGALMPRLDISGPDLARIREFLTRLN